eukprot:4448874-Pyramimonas_sp.AAC.1
MSDGAARDTCAMPGASVPLRRRPERWPPWGRKAPSPQTWPRSATRHGDPGLRSCKPDGAGFCQIWASRRPRILQRRC